MKALILNSGIGKRMGHLCRNNPKCLARLSDNDTILSRQLRILENNGIIDIIMTTGPFQNLIIEYIRQNSPGLNIQFVNNPIYDSTNYIYSIYLAKDKCKGDLLLLHGDMIFDEKVLSELINNPESDLVLIDKEAEIPEKDFKGRIINEMVVEIGVNLFGKDCYTLMPVYKISEAKLAIWLNEIEDFINDGNLSVYAENAFNQVSKKIALKPSYYSNQLCMEVDTPEDLAMAKMKLSN
jgi:choline kinase